MWRDECADVCVRAVLSTLLRFITWEHFDKEHSININMYIITNQLDVYYSMVSYFLFNLYTFLSAYSEI